MVVGTGLCWDDGSALEVDGGRGERGLTDALSATQLHDFAISVIFYVLPKGKRGTQLSSWPFCLRELCHVAIPLTALSPSSSV